MQPSETRLNRRSHSSGLLLNKPQNLPAPLEQRSGNDRVQTSKTRKEIKPWFRELEKDSTFKELKLDEGQLHVIVSGIKCSFSGKCFERLSET